LRETAAIRDRTLGKDPLSRRMAVAGLQMTKRLASIAAMIGATVVSMVLAPSAAWADKRVALIVGNSTYQTVPQLPNPSRDASAVAKMFKDAGFDTVDLQVDVGNLEFKRAIRRFEATADQADIAVVYYAGHGLEITGTNYLIPVDARLASDRDADDEAIPLERLVSSADGARRLRLVILDACRDNPFVSTMRRERKVASRGVVAGLGKVEPTSTDTLIAYAAKAGSTADDGDGQHSPFTAAVLKNLTIPGLDVRLAFGRVRDEVLKVTANRQEPFVYGSLGGGNVSLVPPLPVPQETPVSDVKADYELVQQIGTKRAWEVFLGTHPTGFYAELARAQIEQLSNQLVNPAPPPPGNVTVAALPPDKTPSGRDSSSKEAVEWDKVKDSTEPTVLQKFIKRFPDSPLANNAQQRIDVLNKAAQEREEQARAARRAAEEAKRLADQQKAELAAQKKREDDERRARDAEAAEKAKAAAAAAVAQKKREDDERRAAAAEADRQAKAAEAERKAAEAKQKAEQAQRDKAAADAAAAQAAAEKQAREAEAARKKVELAAANEATCKDEQGKLDTLIAKGSEGTGVDDLKGFSRTVTCDRLGPVVVAALDRFNAEAAKRAAIQPNSLQLVRSAQTELIRLGCLTGKADGTMSDPTKAALGRYLSIGGQPTDNISVTEALVTELSKHTSRVCPIECKADETLKGETCVANANPAASPAAASKSDDEDNTKPRRKQADRQQDREPPRRPKPAAEAPHARQQAQARPSIVSGGGGGGGGGSHAIIGVGF
jgi:Caspase domain